MQSPAMYTFGAAAAVLSVSESLLQLWVDDGIVPTTQDPPRVDAEYVDKLAALLGMERTFGSQPDIRQSPMVVLYHFAHLPTAEESVVALKEMVNNGTVMRVTQCMALLAPYAETITIYAWIRKGRMPVVMIGRTYYMTVTTCMHIMWLYSHCKTTEQANILSGYDVSWIHRQVRRGVWHALYGPDGRYPRFPPEAVAQICASRARVSVVEAARRLRISESQLKRYLQANRTAVDQVHRIGVTEAFVAHWKQKFDTLNDGFDWLVVGMSADHVVCVNGKQVIKQLQISLPTLSVWCGEGLLPFYTRSFHTATPNRDFVREYVTGLARFANGNVTKRQAKKYLKMCQALQHVV